MLLLGRRHRLPYDARNGEPLEFLLTPHGGHLSWVRNLLFLVLERLVGPRPEPFFFVVLATRLVNVALFFAVVRTWTGSALLAVVWATLWGTSPRNAVTLSWFAGHGQMVVGTVMLILLWRAAALTARGLRRNHRTRRLRHPTMSPTAGHTSTSTPEPCTISHPALRCPS